MMTQCADHLASHKEENQQAKGSSNPSHTSHTSYSVLINDYFSTCREFKQRKLCVVIQNDWVSPDYHKCPSIVVT